jgi:hypothetical protein
MAESQTVQDALKRFKTSRDAYEAQRQREQDDLQFQVPELQWDAESRRQREGTVVGNVAIPPRPTLSISKLDQPVQMVLNQQKSAHLGVNIHPLSEDADADTAEMLQGLYRHIERDSRAQQARSWAFERAVKAGMGYYRVNTIYDEHCGSPFDQKVVLQRILQQDMVFLDPSAQEPDWSDGEYAFVCTWLSMDRFKREYPQSALADYDARALQALVRDVPDWVRVDGEAQNAVLVAEYFRVEYVDREYVQLTDGRVVFRDELGEADAALVAPDARRRAVRVPRVWWSVINGVEELTEPQEWNGRYIPIIPVVGRELQPFDGERRFVGMIRPAKDGQRLFNYAASNAVEIAALEPRAPFLMAEGQNEGYERMWEQANTRNFPALIYKPTTVAGQPAAPPQRVPVDASRMSTSMALMQQADAFIQTTTAVFDPALGRISQSERSGRALLALQQQSDAGTSHYIANLADIAMVYEAKVVLDLIPRIYDRPGRVVQLLTGEDDSKQALINQPFVTDPRTGRPMPAVGGVRPAAVKHYDLQQGVYGVSVSIGRSYQTRLQEGADEIGQILQAAPQLLPLIGPIYFRFRDFPGAREIADLLKQQRAQMFPYLAEDESQGPPPEVLVPQLQQQLQQLQQQLAQAADVIKGEQVKQQAQVQVEQVKQQTQLEVEQLKQQTQLELESLKARTDLQIQAMKNDAQLEAKRIEAMAQGMRIDPAVAAVAASEAWQGAPRPLSALRQAARPTTTPRTYVLGRDDDGALTDVVTTTADVPARVPMDAPLEAPLDVEGPSGLGRPVGPDSAP